MLLINPLASPMNTTPDWAKAATVLGVVSMVIGAVKELWRDHDKLKDVDRRLEDLEKREKEAGAQRRQDEGDECGDEDKSNPGGQE